MQDSPSVVQQLPAIGTLGVGREEDGTPLIVEIDETDKNFETIYEHRKGAKDRSIASVSGSAYFA